MAPTQKALIIKEAQAPFTVADVPILKPGKGEILIKVQSASLNPVDWKIRQWNVLIDGYPAILGSDIAGDVEEVGEGVTEFKKGDRVFGQTEFIKERGAFQQYTPSLAATTSKIPPSLSYDDVTTLPMGLSTAYSALYSGSATGLALTPPAAADGFGKYADTPIVILGGSTSVAQFALQLAKASGFSPIITTAASKHIEALTPLGATHILDRSLTTEQLKAEIAKITSKPINLVFDTVSGAATQQLALDLLAPGGTAVFVLPSQVTPTDGKKIAQAYAGLRSPHNVELLETLYHDKIYGWLEKGIIVPNRVEVVPNGLNGAPKAFERLEADQVSRVKLVAHPQETV